jgi:uncharacterized ferredoxin-like protein
MVEFSGIPTDIDMRKINAVSAYPLTADQVFIFRMKLCDNDVDQDFDRFTTDTLHNLAKMYVGKPGVIDGQKAGRIYDAYVSADIERITEAGDIFCEVIAHVYVLRSAVSQERFEALIKKGMKKVAVGCSFVSTTCSICGEESCSHIKGNVYDGKLCFKNFNSLLDVYEWAVETDSKKPDEGMTLDSAIYHCYEVANRLKNGDACDFCAIEHEQLAHWLEELKRLRVECDGMRSNWYKSVERIKELQGERDAAVDDLRKLVPAWKWDGAGKQQNQQEEAPKSGRVEFG